MLAPNVAESSRIAQPEPTVATRAPPAVAPTAERGVAGDRHQAVRLLQKPGRHRSRDESDGGRGVEGGGHGERRVEGDDLPQARVPGDEQQSERELDAEAHSRSEPIITSRRGSRSATTPPTRSVEIWASVQAANASPTSVADPVRSSTAKATAIGTRFVPKKEIVRAGKSRRKFRLALQLLPACNVVGQDPRS